MKPQHNKNEIFPYKFQGRKHWPAPIERAAVVREREMRVKQRLYERFEFEDFADCFEVWMRFYVLKRLDFDGTVREQLTMYSNMEKADLYHFFR